MRRGHFSDVEPDGMNWRALKLVFPYLMEFKQRVVWALLCLVAAKLASVVGPFFLKHIVDTLDVDANTSAALAVVPVGLVLAYGLARFSGVLFGEIRDTVFGRVAERAMRRIGLQVFEHMHQLDLDFHLNRQTGGLSRDIERGITGISFVMRFLVFNIVPTLLEISMVVAVFWWNYGVIFALITLLAIVAYVAFSVVATEWRTGFVRDMNQADSATTTRAIDSLMNYETVKYFTNESYEAGRYDEELAKWETARRNNRLSMFALNGGQALIIAIAMTSMMWLAAVQVADQVLSIGDFVLINAFMMQLFLPLNFLGFVYREIKGALANIEQMFELLARKAKVVEASDATPLLVSKGAIRFRNVSFHYRDDRPILENVSFDVLPGQKVAVVGASGAGKSTLVKLLFRFYDPIQGAILIDDQDIHGLTLQSLRQSIGIVPQDTVLFNDTIFENVRYGRPSASDAEVHRAIELAHLKHFIEELPQGVDTLVGERGLKLSGGEKQRVAIARTILKKPPILVFDEATSSLDSRSEQAILEAIKEVAEQHTSLMIAHRLSTIVDADNIVVLGRGRVVEQGSHQQLLDKNGYYAELWRLQQQEQRESGVNPLP
jgi:ATP-binding cassette subfamily B protein